MVIRTDITRILISPPLIWHRRTLQVDLLTDGEPTLTHDSALADVDVNRTSAEATVGAAGRALKPGMVLVLAIATAVIAVCILLLAAGRPAARDYGIAVAAAGAPLVLIYFLSGRFLSGRGVHAPAPPAQNRQTGHPTGNPWK
jgi:hypothetical protein